VRGVGAAVQRERRRAPGPVRLGGAPGGPVPAEQRVACAGHWGDVWVRADGGDWDGDGDVVLVWRELDGRGGGAGDEGAAGGQGGAGEVLGPREGGQEYQGVVRLWTLRDADAGRVKRLVVMFLL